MDLNVVRRISIEATTKGVSDATGQLNKLKDAQGNIVQVSEKQERATLSVQRALDRQQRALDQNYRAMKQFERAQSDLDKARAQGLISLDRFNRLSELNKQRLNEGAAANDNLAQSMGLSAAAASRLGLALSTTLAAGVTAVVGAMFKSVDAFQKFESQGFVLDSVLKSTGFSAGRTAADIEALVTGIGNISKAREAATVLLTFRSVAGETFDRTLKLADDLAAVMRTDISSAALQLGKALEDPEKGLSALTRSGVSFSAQQKEVIKDLFETGQVAKAQGLILDQVAKQVGGAGAAADAGLAGSYEALSDATQRLLEQWGQQIATGLRLTAVINGIASAIDAAARSSQASENQETLRALIQANRNGTLVNGQLPVTPLQSRQQAIDANMDSAELGRMTAVVERQREAYDGVTRAIQKETEELKKSELQKSIDINLRKAQVTAASAEGQEIIRLTTLHQREADAVKKAEEAKKEAEAATKRHAETLRRFGEEQTTRMQKLEAERKSIGMSEEAATALKTAEQDLARLRERGVVVDEDMEQRIRDRAKEYAREKAAVDDLKESYRDMQSAINGLAQGLFRAFTSGGDAIRGATQALAGFGSKLASTQLDRFLKGDGFGTGNLLSGQGALGMIGAGAMGYQSGNPLMGALGGAMAGAAFGPIGMGVGAVVGGIGGLFGQSAQKKQQQQSMMAEAARINAQARLIGLDTDTRSGSLQALQINQEAELQQFAAQRNWAAVQASIGAHRMQVAALNKEWDKRELEAAEEKRKEALRIAEESARELLNLQRSFDDRRLAATTDASTIEGALALFDRQAQREREALAENQTLRENYAAASVDLELTLAIERLQIQDEFNKKTLEETKRAQEQQIAAITRAARQITDYLLGLRTGVDSPLSPSMRLSTAQTAYNATLGLAQGGNVDALDRITKDAETLRQAAQAFFGSSTGYQTIFNQIQSQLGGLSAIQDSEDPVVRALNQIAMRQEEAYFNEIADSTDTSAAYNATMITGLDRIYAILSSFPGFYTAMITALNAAAAAQAALAAAEAARIAQEQAAAAAFRAAEEQRYNNDLAAWQFSVTFGGWSSIPGQVNYLPPPDRSRYKFRMGGVVPGYADGGMVGNGMWDQDSVLARYAGGGNIALAGGEFVMPAPQTRMHLPQLEAMRSGVARNDNGEVVAMLARLGSTLARIEAGEAKNVAATEHGTEAMMHMAGASAREVRLARRQKRAA